MHEERNTSLLHGLELEDRLKDKEDERKCFKEQTDQKENEPAMRINYLERKLKEEMKLNETFLLEAAQTLDGSNFSQVHLGSSVSKPFVGFWF